MNNELLPMKKKENIFQRIKDFFFNLFKKNKETKNYSSNAVISSVQNIEEKIDFADDLKVSVSNEPQKRQEKEEFIKQIENDNTILEKLSVDRLLKLNEYYDQLIEKDKIELKRLNSN